MLAGSRPGIFQEEDHARTSELSEVLVESEIPDWSEKTLALLETLSLLERSFVEWNVAGYSAAEAYRRAKGQVARSGRDASRQMAFKIRARARVRLAIHAAMSDRNFTARMDREWQFQKLHRLVDECLDSNDHRNARIALDAIRLVAKLQGELDRPKTPPPITGGLDTRANIEYQINNIVQEARASVTGGTEGPLLAIESQVSESTCPQFIEEQPRDPSIADFSPTPIPDYSPVLKRP